MIMPWYAALLALVYVGLSVRVIRGRGLYRVNLGVGSNDDMERRSARTAILRNTCRSLFC